MLFLNLTVPNNFTRENRSSRHSGQEDVAVNKTTVVMILHYLMIDKTIGFPNIDLIILSLQPSQPYLLKLTCLLKKYFLMKIYTLSKIFNKINVLLNLK